MRGVHQSVRGIDRKRHCRKRQTSGGTVPQRPFRQRRLSRAIRGYKTLPAAPFPRAARTKIPQLSGRIAAAANTPPDCQGSRRARGQVADWKYMGIVYFCQQFRLGVGQVFNLPLPDRPRVLQCLPFPAGIPSCHNTACGSLVTNRLYSLSTVATHTPSR